VSSPPWGRLRQAAVYLDGLAGRRPRVPADGTRLEAAAERVLSRAAFAYVAGGAGAGRTMASNRRAFDAWALVPRMAAGAGARDLSVTLFGAVAATPLLLAPVGVLGLAHPDADLAVARAAAAEGVPVIWSNQASVPMEACARAMDAVPGAAGAARWFQLYPGTSDAVCASLLRRARACGCTGVVLTVDTTQLGWRPRDLDLGYLPFLRGHGIAQYVSDPVFLAEAEAAARAAAAGAPGGLGASPPTSAATLPRLLAAALAQARRHARDAAPGSAVGGPLAALRSGAARRAVQHFLATYSRPSLTWDDVARLRAMTPLPFLVKGVLHADDAERALAAGASGVVVSNHGGRQVDGAVAALDALPDVASAVAGRGPVLFDSGVRTGADAAKALALGAAAVCVGRPYVYGLALDGERGVRAVLANLRAELDLVFALCGAARAGDLRLRAGPDARAVAGRSGETALTG
jgi:lactate 2-monooxygenase